MLKLADVRIPPGAKALTPIVGEHPQDDYYEAPAGSRHLDGVALLVEGVDEVAHGPTAFRCWPPADQVVLSARAGAVNR